MNQQEKLYNTVRTSGVIGIVSGAVVIVFSVAAFVTAIPGIIIQLVLIPILVYRLQKAHLIG